MLFTADLKSFAGQLAASTKVKSEEVTVKTEGVEINVQSVVEKHSIIRSGKGEDRSVDTKLEVKERVEEKKKVTQLSKKRKPKEVGVVTIKEEVAVRRSKRTRT